MLLLPTTTYRASGLVRRPKPVNGAKKADVCFRGLEVLCNRAGGVSSAWEAVRHIEANAGFVEVKKCSLDAITSSHTTEHCPSLALPCVNAAIEDPTVIVRTLALLGLPTRAPPRHFHYAILAPLPAKQSWLVVCCLVEAHPVRSFVISVTV